jgi:hypothetical protein
LKPKAVEVGIFIPPKLSTFKPPETGLRIYEINHLGKVSGLFIAPELCEELD